MRLGCFITKTRPEERGDTFSQCYKMAKDLFDVVTVIDGEKTWPKEFNWPVIGEHFQRGYEQCDADVVIHLDCDFIFHEKDFKAIREACETYDESPALSFYKWQFVLPDRYNLKSRLVIAVNKGKFGDRIRFDSGGDLCQPSLDGKYLSPDDVPESGIAFYNFEKLIKSETQIKDDCGRMERAYYRHFGKYQWKESDGTDEAAYRGWLNMVIGRFSKPQQKVSLESLPKYIQTTVKNLEPNQWGYNGFGNLPRAFYNGGDNA